MSKTTAKNEIYVVLQKYLKNRKAAKVAETVYSVMQAETRHDHNGKNFFINEDSNGILVLTMESMVKGQMETILQQNLEEDKVQECLEQLMAVSVSTETEMTAKIETISTETEMTAKIEAISIDGSDSQIYSDVLNHYPAKIDEEYFLEHLEKAVNAGVKAFKVPVCDPSIAKNGSLQFVADWIPATGRSYDRLKELAEKNEVQLGSRNQYFLFLATIIHRLWKEMGWNESDAFFAVCCDSKELGNYRNYEVAKGEIELTGSRKIAGKCDLGNTYKILKDEDDDDGLWIAGGSYSDYGHLQPLVRLTHVYADQFKQWKHEAVGWFVFE